MVIGAKVREAAERVTAAASDTRQAVIGIGVLAGVALLVGLVALVIGSRRPRAARL